MSPLTWSIVSAAASIGGIWLGGYEPRWGWWWGIPCQWVWAAYGWFTGQYGMIALSVVFTALYVRNLWRNRGSVSYRQQAADRGEVNALRRENADLRAKLIDCDPVVSGGAR